MSISIRCGKGNYEFYDKNNKISSCSKFDNRILCPTSNKQRRKSANKSKKRNNINFY